MPVKLHDFIHASGHDGDGIAGYLEPGASRSDASHRFVYWRSSNAMLPAFVNCLEGGGDMRRIYTNHERAPWVRPRGPGVKRRDNLRAESGDGSLMVEPVSMTTRAWPARVVGPVGLAPLSGGLHAAALSSSTSAGTTGERGARERGEHDATRNHGGHDASGLARSLRHYALATRTLIASSAASGFAGVHDHVGAILVSDAGEILAAGINTGSYRHAEVSLLLSWFRDHPAARTLPAKSIVFSTLTPCRQCTRYLSLAKAADTLIRFDEADAGRSGRVGERIAERIDTGLGPERDPGHDAGLGSTSPGGLALESAPAGAKVAGDVTSSDGSAVREAERRAIRNDGTGGSSRIDRSREARRAVLDAAGAAGWVPGRAAGRHRPADADACRTEAAVLAYLAEWIFGAARVP